jgi:hypothetical protein
MRAWEEFTYQIFQSGCFEKEVATIAVSRNVIELRRAEEMTGREIAGRIQRVPSMNVLKDTNR